MVTSTAQGVSGRAQDPVKPLLNVVLLYEDLSTALRAKESLHRIARQLGTDAGFHAAFWRLDLLGEPLRVEQAAIEAAAADVIILSLHSGRELRAEACGWLERWLAYRKEHPYALAALFDAQAASTEKDIPVVAHMKRVAQAAGADLFFGFGNASVAAPGENTTTAC